MHMYRRNTAAIALMLPIALGIWAFVFGGSVAIAQGDTDNPIMNPGAELVASGEPVGWGRYTPSGDARATTLSTEARTGKYSFMIDVDEARRLRPDLTRIRQSWRLDAAGLSTDTYGEWPVPGQMHRVSFYYRTEGDPRLGIQIERRAQTSTGIVIDNSNSLFPPSAEWTYAEYDFLWPHPDTHTDWFLIMFFATNAEHGKLWIDDIRLERPQAISGANEGTTRRTPGTYYVAPDGDDLHEGSKEQPWATLSKVSQEAQAGDTFIFLPGEYQGILQPRQSGTAAAPITFRAAERRTAKFVGTTADNYAVRLEGIEHIRLEGLHIQPKWAGRWFLAQNANHIYVNDVLMEKAQGGMPFLISRCEHVYVRDSVLREYAAGNMARISHSQRILFEGNAISRTGHSPLQFYPAQSDQFIVVRNNVFHPTWGRPLEFFSPRHLLFEGNIITHSFYGGRSNSAAANYLAEHVVFRFNRVFRNWGCPLQLQPWDLEPGEGSLPLTEARIYHNVFGSNDEAAMRILERAGSAPVRDNILINNVFDRNDPYGDGRQLVFNANAENMRFVHNMINGMVAATDSHVLDLASAQSGMWRTLHGDQFQDNMQGDPGFVDAESCDYRLNPTSTLLDAAVALTHTTRAGEGRVLPVEDTLYFYDGFAMEGEQGDLIAVGEAGRVARIVQIDREAGALILDRSIAWDSNEPVSVAWAGAAPDMGAYEHGSQGRVSIAIVAEPFLAAPGQEISLTAHIFGDIQPVSVEWDLGDGTLAHGAHVVHRYDFAREHPNSPGGFPVRVRVTDAQGASYVGVGFVEDGSTLDPLVPLLHTTFDAEDEDWWWTWKSYRPEPTDWQRELDSASGQGVLRVSNPGAGKMPLKTAPAQWDIDRYPWVYLRYRVLPATPIGLYLEAFRQGNQEPRLWTAATSGKDTPYRLIDDGEWHTLVVDARIMRQVYPEMRVAQGVGMEITGTSRQGDTYWLDEVAILSQEAALSPAWQAKLAMAEIGHLEITSPQAGATVHGRMPIAFQVMTYTGVDGEARSFNVERLDVEVDDQLAVTVGVPVGDLLIDTTRWPDGRHHLTVRASDQGGQTLEQAIPLTISNRVQLIDHLDPPRLFSFWGETMLVDNSRTLGESPGWTYATNDATDPIRDEGRKVKASADEEYLLWLAPELRDYTVVIYAGAEDIRSAVHPEARVGADEWVELDYFVEPGETLSSDWTEYVLTGRAPDGMETEGFRLRVGPAFGPGSLQVGQVRLDIRRIAE